MNPLAVLEHDLVGVDRNGYHCACSTVTVNHLEHLGEIALAALNAPPARPTKGPSTLGMWLPEHTDALIDLHAAGYNDHQIGDELGFDHSTIANHRRALGLPTQRVRLLGLAA